MFSTNVIYKLDTKGKIRTWQAFADGNSWYTVAGLIDGKKVTSEPKIVEATNVGRSNERNEEEQAIFEATADMEKKLTRGYFLNIDDVGKFDKFKPMLANDYTKLKAPLVYPVWSQPKLDGIRCIYMNGKLWTRAGKEIVSCPHIVQALMGLDKDIILDGELYNHELRDDFNEITSIVRKTKPKTEDYLKSEELIQFHVYDQYSAEPFWTRLQKLFARLKDNDIDRNYIKPVDTQYVSSDEELNELYGRYLNDEYEGQMVRLNEKYENKRSKYLLKRKEFITDEYDVIGVEEGLGNWSGAIKRFHFKTQDGQEFSAGVRGTYEKLSELLNSGKKPDWATVRYFTPTPDGIPRFPVVTDYGWGKRED